MHWWELPILIAGVLGVRYVMSRFDAGQWLTRASWGLVALYCILTSQWLMIVLMVSWYVYLTEIQQADDDDQDDVVSGDGEIPIQYPGLDNELNDDKSGGVT